MSYRPEIAECVERIVDGDAIVPEYDWDGNDGVWRKELWLADDRIVAHAYVFVEIESTPAYYLQPGEDSVHSSEVLISSIYYQDDEGNRIELSLEEDIMVREAIISKIPVPN